MNCPSCSSPLESTARFCGVCGYRLQVTQPKAAPPRTTPQPQGPGSIGTPVKSPRPAMAKPKPKSGDEIYLNQVLNNRFKIESKIGEGGFGAVYRGVQLATGRKV